MTREEKLDWLYRLKSEIFVYMPKEWLIPMADALDDAIKALEQEPTKNDLGVDLIPRGKVMQLVHDNWLYGGTVVHKIIEQIVNDIQDMPSVTPQEPRKGHWKDIPKYKDIAWYCSECEHFTTMKHNYCPKCGVDMRADRSEEDAKEKIQDKN